jgi:hypothetical protein
MPSTPYNISLGLCVFSQNIQKHYVSVANFLEAHSAHYEILLFQEAPWALIKHVPSSEDARGTPEWGALAHPDWIPLVPRTPQGDKPHIIAYVSW